MRKCTVTEAKASINGDDKAITEERTCQLLSTLLTHPPPPPGPKRSQKKEGGRKMQLTLVISNIMFEVLNNSIDLLLFALF